LNSGDQKVIEYLRLAYAQELAQIRTLQSHSDMAAQGGLKKDIKHHLTETARHARLIRERLGELGYLESEGTIERALGTVQSVVAQTVAIAKAPIDIFRGKGDAGETMLRNAMDDAAAEEMEIATYIALEAIAEGIGDKQTAELAATIKADEIAMLEKLEEHLPELTDMVLRSQVVDPEAVRQAS